VAAFGFESLRANILPLRGNVDDTFATRPFPNGAHLSTMTMYRGSIPGDKWRAIGNGRVAKFAAAETVKGKQRSGKLDSGMARDLECPFQTTQEPT
jgi:hypothetical protein